MLSWLAVGHGLHRLKEAIFGGTSVKHSNVSLIEDKSDLKLSVESVLSTFKLSTSTLRRLMHDLNQQIDLGLEFGLDQSSLAMLPSYVPELPNGQEIGKYLALDLDGPNLRVLLLDIEKPGSYVQKAHNFRVPSVAMHSTEVELFDFIVSCLDTFVDEYQLNFQPLSLGFTFSQPCDQTSIKSAVLLIWTKGYSATGVIKNDVVQLLENALKENPELKLNVEAVLNDTVGTLIATAFEEGACTLGVIIGGGSNAAYMESASNIRRLDLSNYRHSKMIVHTEWGAFGDGDEIEYVRNKFDRVVDEESKFPGFYRFDKLLAGQYMGELVRLVLLHLIDNGFFLAGAPQDLLKHKDTFPTKLVAEILGDETEESPMIHQIMHELLMKHYTVQDMQLLRQVCYVVSKRSADLAAAAIACLLNRTGEKNAVIGVDGNTFHLHPFYKGWVEQRLSELVQPGVQFKLVQASDGGGKGAALVAAIAQRLKDDATGSA